MLHPLTIEFDRRIPMRDGVTLSADLILPQAARQGGRFPCILVRTPYVKASAARYELGRWFAERGYVVVNQDVRGRGDSDGIFEPYFNEGRDGYDTIEWCAAQPWCDGSVGTYGGSYLGRVQWLAALEQPPHLKTMIVMVTPSDPFVETPTGSPSPMHLCWLHYTAGHANQVMEAVPWDEVYQHLPLNRMDEAAGRLMPAWKQECEHPWLDAYWQPLCYQKRFAEINLPVLHISGWYDDEQVGTPRNFIGMTRQASTDFARAHQRLLMGPWGHAINSTQKLGEVDFGAAAIIDLRLAQLDWFDRHLKGLPGAPEHAAPVRIFVMGKNQWRDEQEFPLARTRWQRYYLHSDGSANSRYGDGSLTPQPPLSEPADRFHYDPSRPYPFLTEPTSSQIGGPDDYAAVLRRDDVLFFASEPLTADTEVTGPIQLELFATSSAPDTDFTAMLLDVHPNGFIQRLCDGIVRARFRLGMDHPALIEPGAVLPYTIDLWYTSQVFRLGHRIALSIASSAFPKFDRNLNTGEDLAASSRLVTADQTVYHTAATPSALILPVID
jgi:hypothetical protein